MDQALRRATLSSIQERRNIYLLQKWSRPEYPPPPEKGTKLCIVPRCPRPRKRRNIYLLRRVVQAWYHPPPVRNDVKLLAHFWAAKNPIVKNFWEFFRVSPTHPPKMPRVLVPGKKWNWRNGYKCLVSPHNWSHSRDSWTFFHVQVGQYSVGPKKRLSFVLGGGGVFTLMILKYHKSRGCMPLEKRGCLTPPPPWLDKCHYMPIKESACAPPPPHVECQKPRRETDVRPTNQLCVTENGK